MATGISSESEGLGGYYIVNGKEKLIQSYSEVHSQCMQAFTLP